VARFLKRWPGHCGVQQAPATNLFDGLSTANIGGALPGASRSVSFTIQNTGVADLTGLGITFDGADSGKL